MDRTVDSCRNRADWSGGGLVRQRDHRNTATEIFNGGGLSHVKKVGLTYAPSTTISSLRPTHI